jgi:hypothetical protein
MKFQAIRIWDTMARLPFLGRMNRRLSISLYS